MTIRRILTTVDATSGGPGGTARWCAAWASIFPADVVAIHFASVSDWPLPFVTTRPCSGDGDAWWLADIGERLHDTWVRSIESAGVPVRVALLHGNVEQVLCAAAREHQVDLVVLGGGHMGRLGVDVLADMAHHILAELERPVLVVRGRVIEPGDGPVIVAVDGGVEARTALEEGVRWAELTRSRLIACTSIQLGHAPPEVLEPFRAREIATARADLDHMLSPLRERDIECEGLVVAGHDRPGTQVADVAASHQASVLVVGSRSGLGALVSSCSQQLSVHAPCPVLIVPAVIRRGSALSGNASAETSSLPLPDAAPAQASLRPIGGHSR